MKRLHINVDHVATIRQARKIKYPDPVTAALMCEMSGADGITVHLREDRRHIQDRDVRILKETVKTILNLEMATSPEIIKIALTVVPDIITLVPEKRQELTTEGGLNLKSEITRFQDIIKQFHDKGIRVSLFIDPDKETIQAAKETGAEQIELHTGRYCDATAQEMEKELQRIIEGAQYGAKLGLKIAAGHGLNYDNIIPVAKIKEIEEFNIGHSIVAHSIFVGIQQAVREMKNLITYSG